MSPPEGSAGADELAGDDLTDEEVTTAVGQLSDALSRTQQNRDEFVRVIAAGGVAVAASLIAAFGSAG